MNIKFDGTIVSGHHRLAAMRQLMINDAVSRITTARIEMPKACPWEHDIYQKNLLKMTPRALYVLDCETLAIAYIEEHPSKTELSDEEMDKDFKATLMHMHECLASVTDIKALRKHVMVLEAILNEQERRKGK